MKPIYPLILLIILFQVLAPAPSYAGPSLMFKTELHDFGIVRQGDMLEFSFEFTNSGTDELLIKRLSPS